MTIQLRVLSSGKDLGIAAIDSLWAKRMAGKTLSEPIWMLVRFAYSSVSLLPRAELLEFQGALGLDPRMRDCVGIFIRIMHRKKLHHSISKTAIFAGVFTARCYMTALALRGNCDGILLIICTSTLWYRGCTAGRFVSSNFNAYILDIAIVVWCCPFILWLLLTLSSKTAIGISRNVKRLREAR